MGESFSDEEEDMIYRAMSSFALIPSKRKFLMV